MSSDENIPLQSGICTHGLEADALGKPQRACSSWPPIKAQLPDVGSCRFPLDIHIFRNKLLHAGASASPGHSDSNYAAVLCNKRYP